MDYKAYFKQYKTNLSLLKLKQIEERELFKEIQEIKHPSIKAQVRTGMPIYHDEDNSPVEKFIVKTEERLEKLNYKLQQARDEIQEIKNKIIKVEACLDILKDRERFVIRQYYIEEAESWEDVANAYQCHYREWRSIRQLITYRDCALNKINQLLKT